MYKFLTKNGQTLAFLLGALVVGIYLAFALPGSGEFDTLSKEAQYETSIFNFGLMAARWLIIPTFVAIVIFGVYQIATNFKDSFQGILGFIVLLGVFLLAFFMATTEVTPFIQGAIDNFEDSGNELSDNNLKFIGGGITTAVILIAVAALAFIVSELRNMFFK